MITLDEAIQHCEEVAEQVMDGVEDAEIAGIHVNYVECEKCAEEHRQLAEWLKLLKRILDSGDCNDCAMIHNQCRYAPEWGEQVRYNCPFYSREEEQCIRT